MRKTIDRKTYDTGTAERIGSWHNGLSVSDFSFCCEFLYKTKKGNFFLYGEGGALSSYSRSVGSEQSGGSDIIPMTEERAANWAEVKDQECFDEHFHHLAEEA